MNLILHLPNYKLKNCITSVFNVINVLYRIYLEFCNCTFSICYILVFIITMKKIFTFKTKEWMGIIVTKFILQSGCKYKHMTKHLSDKFIHIYGVTYAITICSYQDVLSFINILDCSLGRFKVKS